MHSAGEFSNSPALLTCHPGDAANQRKMKNTRPAAGWRDEEFEFMKHIVDVVRQLPDSARSPYSRNAGPSIAI